jgi:subtilisin-like proprotein convertase family protein
MRTLKTNMMKATLLIALAAGQGTCPAQLSYDASYTGSSMVIPEGDPVGITFGDTVSSADIPADNTVVDLTVSLNISGGYNADMVAYLESPNGTEITLLDRPGLAGGNPFGNQGAGFNVTLSDAAAGGITAATGTPGQVVTGTYDAVGSLSAVDGSGADGTWTLFLANLGTGSGSPTLNSFSLNLTVVPEPVNVALPAFGTLLALLRVVRRRKIS